jgi:signal peptidase
MLRRVMLGVLCAAVLGAVAVTMLVPLLVGGAALSVRTGSMAPALQVGDLVVDRPADPASLRVGDVATYRSASGALITHRTVAVAGAGRARSFTFRGDANPTADPQPVPAADVTGRVWFSVPYLGTARERLAALRLPIVAGGVLALSGYALAQFAAVARDRRRRA